MCLLAFQIILKIGDSVTLTLRRPFGHPKPDFLNVIFRLKAGKDERKAVLVGSPSTEITKKRKVLEATEHPTDIITTTLDSSSIIYYIYYILSFYF